MTDLTDRMRTCAAFIQARPNDAPMPTEHLLDDAAALLLAAATEIELLTGPIDLGEPMEVIPPGPHMMQNIPPVVTLPPVVAQTSAMWIGDDLKPLPNAPKSRNACPNCDSRAQKTVYREGKQLVLECPVCGSRWRR
jgi:DNA-directed RNA polymerase subunit RPC12/RpoP